MGETSTLVSRLVFGITVLSGTCSSVPIVVNTWPWPQASEAAWKSLVNASASSPALDAVQAGCTRCEEDQCDGTVGFGGSPDENGETTLDAMIMDGTKMDIGAVGALRRVKNAIGVARHVLDHTEHTMLVGDFATNFAIENGFPEESLTTPKSTEMWEHWKHNHCQPNYRVDTVPDSKTSCGPYSPAGGNTTTAKERLAMQAKLQKMVVKTNHDTIGMVAIDGNGKVAAGTSTNGLRHKVPGRVGDSPIPGAGCYADDEVGGAAATGDGDIMMRFLPAYQLVESMRKGIHPQAAAEDALQRILKHYPSFQGALIGVTKKGDVGAACTGFDAFQFCVRTSKMDNTEIFSIKCPK